MAKAIVLVDWDAGRRLSKSISPRPEKGILIALEALQEKIAHKLVMLRPKAKYRAEFRFYHGWHSGKTKTPDRRLIESVVNTERWWRSYDDVIFAPSVGYGNALLCESKRGDLMDTLRKRPDGTFEQKMVDTALVADMLCIARQKLYQMTVVVTDDDDMLPGAFQAERWGMDILIFQRKSEINKHNYCNDLVHLFE